MTSSTRMCNLLTEFLASMDHDAPPGSKGRSMMLRKLRAYLWWKGKMSEKQDSSSKPSMRKTGRDNAIPQDLDDISEALKKKDQEKAKRVQNRRRTRGGAPAASGSKDNGALVKSEPKEVGLAAGEADAFAQL